jgi:hypothetical protein
VPRSVVGIREDLEKKGILIREKGLLRFAEDYRFNSSSFASELILGHSSSGPLVWKNAEGKSLKEIQFKQVTGENQLDGVEKTEPTTDAIRLRFWTQLLVKANKLTSLHARLSPSRFSWVGCFFRRAFYLSYLIRQHRSLIHLWIDTGDGSENKRIFEFLKSHSKEIETTFGGKLEWLALNRAFKIEKEFPDGGYAEEDKWPEIQDRMIDGMIKLDKALRPFIENLEI